MRDDSETDQSRKRKQAVSNATTRNAMRKSARPVGRRRWQFSRGRVVGRTINKRRLDAIGSGYVALAVSFRARIVAIVLETIIYVCMYKI